MLIYSPPGGGIVQDSLRRDQIFGSDEADIFALRRDGKRDTIHDFQDGIDLIDITAFNVTFAEVFIKQVDTYSYVFEIRGEKTKINFRPPGPDDAPIALSADDFIFAPGAAPPSINIINSTYGPDVLYGTGRPDIFKMNPDDNRDVIRRFELGKDKIDIATFDTSFGDLVFETVRPGRVRVHFDTEVLVIIDASKTFTHEDFSASDFIFG